MSMNLCRIGDGSSDGDGDGETYDANSNGWYWLYAMAEEHGWDRAGTLGNDDMDDPSSWRGGYFTNDGQRVTAEDAKAWADALERARPFDGEVPRWVERVEEFIRFCRGGGFEIW